MAKTSRLPSALAPTTGGRAARNPPGPESEYHGPQPLLGAVCQMCSIVPSALLVANASSRPSRLRPRPGRPVAAKPESAYHPAPNACPSCPMTPSVPVAKTSSLPSELVADTAVSAATKPESGYQPPFHSCQS